VEEVGPDALRCTTPPYRRDIQAGTADLIEDLARIHGYDRLPATLLADSLPGQHANRPLELEEQARDILVSAGLQEVITYSMTTPEREAPLGLAAGDYVRLQNPISSERVAMRQTVLGGILEVTAANLRHTEDIRFFEIGPVFLTRAGDKLPEEPRRLALVMCGRRRPDYWAESSQGPGPALDFFDIKAVVEALVEDFHVSDWTYRPSSATYLHPGQAADLLVRGESVGSFGLMHPSVAAQSGLGDRLVLAAELNLEAILAAVPERYSYEPVPRFPAALRDVAVIVGEDIACDRIKAEIRTAGGSLVTQARLFDVYRGTSVPPGTKSLAFALTYQADDRTLTDKEVDKAHKKIEDRLKHVLKAQIRGKE
jgi:phenylalanyl-tRNA synthetase beta chain